MVTMVHFSFVWPGIVQVAIEFKMVEAVEVMEYNVLNQLPAGQII